MMKTKEEVLENLDTILHFELSEDFKVNRHDLANLIIALRYAEDAYEKSGDKYCLDEMKELSNRVLILYTTLENKADQISKRLASYYHD